MDEPNYYAVIPADVRYDKNITHGAKLLYGEITALCNQKGFCWATNEYFASLYQTTERTIKNWISSLNDNGYISVNFRYKEGTKMIESRCISLPILVGKEISSCGEENFQRWGNNFPKGGEENFTHNITNNNTTNNNTLKENTKRKVDVENASLGLGFDVENWFKSFWEIYPKKVAKKEGLKSFKKVCKNENTYNDIMKGLTTQIVAKGWEKDNTYCPNASTWLNQERWTDEVGVKKKNATVKVTVSGNVDKYGNPIF